MKNVLFISIDDLINVVRYRHAYGTPFQTPNIDRLLDMGTYFNGAHALVAECNPSRASVLTGQSLFRTGVEDNNQRFFDLVDPRTTLPYLFREAGYETAAVGKLFHRWVESGDQRGGLIGFMNELFDVHRLTRGDTDRGGEGGGILAGIGPTRRPELQLADHKAVTWASDYIGSQSDSDPWFLAVGLLKPHLEWHVPKRYYNLYDETRIEAPTGSDWDPDTLPLFFQQFLWGRRHREVLAADSWEEAIHAYMAAVSYADAQVGTLLDAMDSADAWRNTTVVLWSDHGYHLGDQEHWGKFTHWEHGTNAPLIIVDPDVGRPGTVVQTPVSLMDIFPTLTELTGVRDTIHRDGHSLVPLMRHPNADWDHFAGTIMDGSISLRTDRYRYIASLDGSEQLYDMVRDPDQANDLALDPDFAPRLERLHQRAAAEVERLGGHIDFLHDRIRGTRGEDAIFVSPNLDEAAGGKGDDLYFAIDPEAIIEKPGGGLDRIVLFAPHDGEDVHARVRGEIEAIEFAPGAGGYVRGSASDSVIGGSGRPDRLLGRGGNDTLDGEGGGDRLVGGGSADSLSGGGGSDLLGGGGSADLLKGGPGADELRGGAGDDRLDGGKGDDRLAGRTGNDRLRGGQDDDRIAGGAGRDELRGGDGRDTFHFKIRAGDDVVRDFRPGKDRIDLTAIDIEGFGSLERETTPEGWALARIPDAGVSIVFHGLHWSDLNAGNFLF